jgi:hypothetical protein
MSNKYFKKYNSFGITLFPVKDFDAVDIIHFSVLSKFSWIDSLLCCLHPSGLILLHVLMSLTHYDSKFSIKYDWSIDFIISFLASSKELIPTELLSLLHSEVLTIAVNTETFPYATPINSKYSHRPHIISKARSDFSCSEQIQATHNFVSFVSLFKWFLNVITLICFRSSLTS